MSLRKNEAVIGKVEVCLHDVKEVEFVICDLGSFRTFDIRIRTEGPDLKIQDALVVKCFHHGSGYHVIKDRGDYNNQVERMVVVKS